MYPPVPTPPPCDGAHNPPRRGATVHGPRRARRRGACGASVCLMARMAVPAAVAVPIPTRIFIAYVEGARSAHEHNFVDAHMCMQGRRLPSLVRP